MLKSRHGKQREPVQLLASGEGVQLIHDRDEQLALVDLRHSTAYYLDRPSFSIGLFFLGAWDADDLSVLQDAKDRIAGFQLAELTCQFSTHPDHRAVVPASSRFLVTPQGVHFRTAPKRDWITLFWQP